MARNEFLVPKNIYLHIKHIKIGQKMNSPADPYEFKMGAAAILNTSNCSRTTFSHPVRNCSLTPKLQNSTIKNFNIQLWVPVKRAIFPPDFRPFRVMASILGPLVAEININHKKNFFP